LSSAALAAQAACPPAQWCWGAVTALLVTQPQPPLTAPSLGEGLPAPQPAKPPSLSRGQGALSPCAGLQSPTSSTSQALPGSRADPILPALGCTRLLGNTPRTPCADQEILRMRKMQYRIASAFLHQTPAPAARDAATPGFMAEQGSRNLQNPTSHGHRSQNVTVTPFPKSKSLSCLWSQPPPCYRSVKALRPGPRQHGDGDGDPHRRPSSARVAALSGINYRPTPMFFGYSTTTSRQLFGHIQK